MRSLFVLALALGCGLGPVGGIHARMGYSEETGLRVIEVPDGPAQDAGLHVGDYILAIDGESIEGQSMREIVESLRGEVGSVVRLDVRRGEEVVELDVQRVEFAGRN